VSAVPVRPWLGLRAALMLAGGRAEGVALFAAESLPDQLARARQSFLALWLCLPMFLAIQAMVPAAANGEMARELAGFALTWLGYAVLSHRLAADMGRAALWPRFVVLWNWCNLVQYLLLVAALVPHLLGAPAVVAQTAWLAAMGWALWLQWSATRLGLGLSGGRAALMVGADMALGLVVLRLTAG
jgi:hypothetical protein